MTTLIESGAWIVGLNSDVSRFQVGGHGSDIERSLSTSLMDRSPNAVTAVVEVLHRISGMRPHALLAATFLPSGKEELRLSVVRGAPFDLSGPSLEGPLALPLRVGLPSSLGEAAADGFLSSPRTGILPGGHLRIEGGGIDHDSSPLVFRRCGVILRTVVGAEAWSEPPEIAVQEVMDAW